MFASRNRLSRPEFTRVSVDRDAKRLVSTHFSVLVSQFPDVHGCSVVVSKKVVKSSVSRHLLKRRIREVLRPWCSGTAGIIVFARAGCKELTFTELSAELTSLLSRVLSQVPK
jgi:ribonuclease P protein component